MIQICLSFPSSCSLWYTQAFPSCPPLSHFRSPLLPHNTELSAFIPHTSLSPFLSHLLYINTLWHDEICLHVQRDKKNKAKHNSTENNTNCTASLSPPLHPITQLIHKFLTSMTRLVSCCQSRRISNKSNTQNEEPNSLSFSLSAFSITQFSHNPSLVLSLFPSDRMNKQASKV